MQQHILDANTPANIVAETACEPSASVLVRRVDVEFPESPGERDEELP